MASLLLVIVSLAVFGLWADRALSTPLSSFARAAEDFNLDGSDPPLPAADVLALLFSDAQRTVDPLKAEASALSAATPTDVDRDIIRSRATQILANPVSSEVGRLVEQTFGVDTFQLTPSLIDPTSASTTRVNPSARVTIGKRISERVYLTFSRSLTSSRDDQIVLLEYDESDRLSWILSRNEDSTYAIEVRVRHSF